MIVCIAEKPSVARDIAKVLGANSRKDGYMEGNNYQVTWTFGHLCTLKEPHDYLPDWKRWSIHSLPILPSRFGIKVINDPGIERQFKTIESLIKSADSVVNCGDAGQEGELIQRWVLQKAGCSCPVKRLWISSLTEEAIREGFDKLTDQSDFDSLYYAGMSRAVGDWLLGINATRLFTIKYGQNRQLISIGRVQTPTLALIVNRQLEIENFKSQPYWELKVTYRDVVFNAEQGRYQLKADALAALDTIRDYELFISDKVKKNGIEAPPRLFDLTSLQVECNKKYGYSADQTLKLIQSLYEKKVTTYPRVDTTFLSNDIYPKVPKILQGLKGYEELTKVLLGAKIRKSSKVFNDKKVTDHHAIIPTGVSVTALSADERNVYNMVTLRFIAAFYPDCKFASTTVNALINYMPFKTTGKEILVPGWRVIFYNDKQKEDTDILPEFEIGEHGIHLPDLQEKETQPPKYYSEATLLRAMETAGKQVDDEELRDVMKENGIGRPSTRAAIIETLYKRHYIQKEKKRLLATPTGVELIGTINNELLKSAELTGQWEKKIRDVEAGDYDVQLFISELKQMVSDIVFDVKSDKKANRIPLVVDVESLPASADTKTAKPISKNTEDWTCPECGKGIILRGNSAYGCSKYKDGCKFIIPFQIEGKKLSKSQVERLVLKGKTLVIKGFVTADEMYDGKVILDKDRGIIVEKELPKKWICPSCKIGEVIKGGAAYGCSNFRSGCQLRIPFIVFGKELPVKQIENLVFKGATTVLKGFDKDGGTVDGKLKFNGEFKLELIGK